MHFAFIFDSVGGTEWLVLLGVVLIVVGPKNLPSAARTLGSVMSKLRRAADEFKRQLLTMDEEFKKGVEAVVSDDDAATSASSSAPAESGTDAAETDAAASGYDDESPYPGHDFYDETQYQNDAPGADADAPSGDAPAASAEAETAAAAEPKADPYAVKITVSTASSAGK